MVRQFAPVQEVAATVFGGSKAPEAVCQPPEEQEKAACASMRTANIQ